MNITIQTIPHINQRYSTVGDWWFDPNGDLQIRVSRMPSERYEQCVAIHELIECLLCLDRGISQQAVDAFDMKFEQDRELGLYSLTAEPGDESSAPYYLEHQFATFVERMLLEQFRLNWDEYNKFVGEM